MRDQFFVLFIVAILVVGCQSQVKDGEGEDGSGNKNDVSKVDEADSATESTISHLDSVTLSRDAEPHQVCEALLTLLQEEDFANAQNLFTREAIAMILRFDLPLAFPGESDATFQVSPAKFATVKRDLCQVLCTILEKVDGETVESQLGWMLKRSKSGWRVSGILLPSQDGKPMDFLNFESSEDIGSLKMMLSGQLDVGQMQATNAVSGN